MKRLIATGTTLVVLALAGTGAALADTGPGWTPPDKTIVEITGDKSNGFEIRHYDGTELFPPTDSEARAECGEYDTRVQRVRCRTEVRVWYRELGRMKTALTWAQMSRE